MLLAPGILCCLFGVQLDLSASAAEPTASAAGQQLRPEPLLLQAAEATAQQAQAQSNAAAAAAAAAEGEAASLRVAMSALRAQHSAKILQLSELEAELRQQASQQGQLLSEGQAAHSKDIADLVRALDVSRQEAAELHSRVSCCGRMSAGWVRAACRKIFVPATTRTKLC